MKFSSISNIGKIRKINEDAYSNISIENYDFFIVADGMGGHSDGDLASSLASSSFVDYIKRSNVSDFDNIISLQKKAIDYANKEVLKLAGEKREKMGTTVVCVCIDYKNSKAHVSHIGDSRVYLYKNKELIQLTKDHSLLNDLIDSGALNEKEANDFANKSAITRAVGISPNTVADTKSIDLDDNDLILMATDGLTNELDEEEIIDIIEKQSDVYDISMSLVDAAINAGGRDNITVTTIRM